MLICRICFTQYPPREGRGRQSPFCSEECRRANELIRRRTRFQQRYHVYDTHNGICVTCGAVEGQVHL